ncbi:MAG: protein kinase [Deltaproteobacteria bacterium]|nr:protein kinase [Deltaproteobacteria bacterium]
MSDKKDILLINRDKDFLRHTADLLGKAGSTVHTAMEMRGALSVLSTNSVGLIICDKDLQDISGNEFLNFIKKDPLRETIPFIFLVPVNDQGRPFKAFELGAIDFLVYPMDGQDLTNRISEIISLQSSENADESSEISPTNVPLQGSQTVLLQPAEKRENRRSTPLPSLEIDVSRDGVLWFPGKIINYDIRGMFVETSLFGKAGVSLMIRFTLPEGTVIVNGQIKHIDFEDFQSPTGTGIEIIQDLIWEKIFMDLESLKSTDLPGATPVGPEKQANPAYTPTEIVRLTSQPQQTPDVYKASLDSPGETDEPSYDTRFYYSLVGKQLDNYRTITFIGSGSMGGVFQSWDVALEREVALKVISYELSSQPAFCDMFIKEARVISKLDHPNIAQIYHIGNSDDILYYVMEFIDGDTLLDLIEKHGDLNSQKGIEYLVTVCETLDFVKEKNIVHRDIKPGNIMIDYEDVVKVVDFGVAKVKDASSKGTKPEEAIMGSPLYISPESLSGQSLDHRSDIYSLGASFYHAFTGYPPFEGDSVQDILDQHLNRPLTPLKEKNSEVSNALGKIIEKMMAKDPKNRYQDYQGIINAFKSIRFRALNRIRNHP